MSTSTFFLIAAEVFLARDAAQAAQMDSYASRNERSHGPSENERAKDNAASWLFAQFGAPRLA